MKGSWKQCDGLNLAFACIPLIHIRDLDIWVPSVDSWIPLLLIFILAGILSILSFHTNAATFRSTVKRLINCGKLQPQFPCWCSYRVRKHHSCWKAACRWKAEKALHSRQKQQGLTNITDAVALWKNFLNDPQAALQMLILGTIEPHQGRRKSSTNGNWYHPYLSIWRLKLMQLKAPSSELTEP